MNAFSESKDAALGLGCIYAALGPGVDFDYDVACISSIPTPSLKLFHATAQEYSIV